MEIALWLLALVLGGIGWRAARSLRALSHTARALGEGDLSVRSDQTSDPVVGSLARSINAMADRVERVASDQQALLAAVSHELRSPLQRLAFGVELMADARQAGETEARLQEVRADIGELDTMVSDLLTWARIDRHTVMREPVELHELLTDLVGKAARLRPDVRVMLEPLPQVTVKADPRHVPRALTNLLNNAVRYADSCVWVHACVVDGQVQVIVDDDGPGVPDDHAERIFEPFVRLDAARSRDAGGVGLGLALARRTAQAHEGALWVERSPRGGARFVYRQPVASNADIAGGEGRSSLRRGGGRATVPG